ncbi:cytochrome P450 [Streptomyces sp. LP05-1]|uniref:Cytochrome P450 n=1 Tax=Streptomyces pyxinae TaxID=2970734 RepID=A0ABT2CFB6_9ACTN|nr:cytochrome P450 [Streptomyces sp. LP05-1]MCS0635777.1 cytochrome P450 [Streptomyces sp. LP05-1]
MPAPDVFVLDPNATDPDAEHKQLRAIGPAVKVDMLGVTVWSVNHPYLLKELLANPDVSRDARLHWSEYDEALKTWPLILWVAVENMFTTYGETRARLRRLVAPAFTARRIQALKPTVDGLAAGLIARLAERPAGEVVDVRTELASPLPVSVISHLMGVPPDQGHAFGQAIYSAFGSTDTLEQVMADGAHLIAMLEELIAVKRVTPGDDLTSQLIAARDTEGDGSALTETELRDTLMLVIAAGTETTVNLIEQTIVLCLTHPEQLDHLRSGRATISDLVEEALRCEPPFRHMPMRYAVHDIPLPDGQVIAQGEAILASYAAANRHPVWHQDADTFDITRPVKEHVAFGHGVHFCLGSALGRLQTASTLAQFFEAFPDARLAVPVEELTLLPSLIFNGHRSLPMIMRPGR